MSATASAARIAELEYELGEAKDTLARWKRILDDRNREIDLRGERIRLLEAELAATRGRV